MGFEGPAASLRTVSEGIAFTRARGLTEAADHLAAGQLETMIDVGEHEQALNSPPIWQTNSRQAAIFST